MLCDGVDSLQLWQKWQKWLCDGLDSLLLSYKWKEPLLEFHEQERPPHAGDVALRGRTGRVAGCP